YTAGCSKGSWKLCPGIISVGPKICGTASRLRRTSTSRTPSVRRIWSGRISTLSPDIRRAQVPLGISKIWSRELLWIGARAPHASAASALPAAAANTTERRFTGLLFQQNGHIVRIVIGAVPVGHERPNAAAAIDEIGERGVRVDVAVLVRDPRGGDAILFAYGGQLSLGAGAADERAIEAAQELLETFGHVPLRIDGHVQDLNVRRRGSQLAARLGKSRQRHRADFRTRCIAEGKQHDLAAEVTDAQLMSV